MLMLWGGGGGGLKKKPISLRASLLIGEFHSISSYIHMLKQWQVMIISVISILCRSVQISSVYTVV